MYLYGQGVPLSPKLTFKAASRFASLNHTIYITADHTPVDVDHAAHAGYCIVPTQFIFCESWQQTYFKV